MGWFRYISEINIIQMNTEQIIQRLTIVKYLYKIGVEQSYQSEAISFFSILSFHDCIDMYLNLAAEKIGIERKKGEKIFFINYWDKIPSLTLRESMSKLNDRRNNLKHKGLIPAKIDIEISRVNTADFFEQNTPVIFGLNFNEVSLFSLIKFESSKSYLQKAQENLDSNKTKECIEEVTKAFHELLYEYKENKRGYGREYNTHFNFIDQIRFSTSRYNSSDERIAGEVDRKLAEVVKQINSNFGYVNKAMEVISLGVDYKKYAKFQILTPNAYRFTDGRYRMEIVGEKNWTKENCQFLIDFVVESAFKLQEFDFDYESLDSKRAIMILKKNQ
jgi:hypothetical protein